MMALPYQQAEPAPGPEARLVVVAAVAAASVALLSFATMALIALRPDQFRSVVSHEWPSFGFYVYTADASASAAVVAGGVAFLAGRRRAATLLVAGSVGVLLVHAADFAYTTWAGGGGNRTAWDEAVMVTWRVAGLIASSVVPLLTVAVFARGRYAARRPRGGG